MKRQLFLTALLASSLGFTAVGQGNFIFSSGGGFVWNNTVNPPVRGGPFNVGFLWSADLSATALVAQVTGLSHIPTNGLTAVDLSVAWNAIMTDPNFHFGIDAGTSNIAVATLTATGGITYNAGSPFGVQGTSTAGGSVMAFFIAWSNLYATPAAAAAAYSSLGWSNPFLYAYTATGVAPTGMAAQAAGEGVDARFGIAVPEPATFILTGLGAVSLLLFRRRRLLTNKRLWLIALLIPCFGLRAAAAGNFVFLSGQGFVWNGGANPPVKGGPFNVAFLWSADLSATPEVAQATGISHTPTNAAVYFPGSVAWSAILNDPNFEFGVNDATGQIAVGTLTLVGGIVYYAGSPFEVTGTSTAGGDVLAFFVAWSNAYATPAAAAVANSPVGWSNPFACTYATSTQAPIAMGNQSIIDGVDARFGVGVPEPSAFTLTVLGMVTLLRCRKRKRFRHEIFGN